MVWACPKGWPACHHSWSTSPWPWEGTRPFTGAAVAPDTGLLRALPAWQLFALHFHAVSICLCKLFLALSELGPVVTAFSQESAQACPCLTQPPVQQAGGVPH